MTMHRPNLYTTDYNIEKRAQADRAARGDTWPVMCWLILLGLTLACLGWALFS